MAEKFKIEKGIPIPPAREGSGLTATLRKLAVGDSIFCRGITQQSVSTISSRFSKRDGLKFVTRKVKGGVRVWRIK